ncbi:MAG: hypothetical protein EOP38_28020 [Rubrivivax sp.]|nr:MAG: hypothetical protein EOP38_28020 [Rubrivivax sp.]
MIMQHGLWKKPKKRVPKLQTESGFRLVRAFTAEHNARRFRAHYNRLIRGFRRDLQKVRLRGRRLRAAKVAAAKEAC